MTSLLFLLFAVVIVAVGCTVIWWKNRQPNSLEFGISEFQRELAALSPDREQRMRKRAARPWETPQSSEPTVIHPDGDDSDESHDELRR